MFNHKIHFTFLKTILIDIIITNNYILFSKKLFVKIPDDNLWLDISNQ
jgi:hypothetical protein